MWRILWNECCLRSLCCVCLCVCTSVSDRSFKERKKTTATATTISTNNNTLPYTHTHQFIYKRNKTHKEVKWIHREWNTWHGTRKTKLMEQSNRVWMYFQCMRWCMRALHIHVSYTYMRVYVSVCLCIRTCMAWISSEWACMHLRMYWYGEPITRLSTHFMWSRRMAFSFKPSDWRLPSFYDSVSVAFIFQHIILIVYIFLRLFRSLKLNKQTNNISNGFWSFIRVWTNCERYKIKSWIKTNEILFMNWEKLVIEVLLCANRCFLYDKN